MMNVDDDYILVLRLAVFAWSLAVKIDAFVEPFLGHSVLLPSPNSGPGHRERSFINRLTRTRLTMMQNLYLHSLESSNSAESFHSPADGKQMLL